MRNLIITILITGFLLGGCSNPVDNSPNVFPSEQDVVVGTVGTECSGCPLVGQWYRFDTLALSQLDNKDHKVTEVLNPVWANDIALLELNIMFEVVEVTPTAVVFRAINAARIGTEGEMCLLRDTEISVTMNREGCKLTSSEPSEMNIYAGTQDHPKTCVTTGGPNTIHVQGVILQSEFTEDCGKAINGEILEGLLPKADLDSTCSCITTGNTLSDEGCQTPDPNYEDENCGGCNKGFVGLNTYLKAFGTLDYLCPTSASEPGVCLSGSFSMARFDTDLLPDCASP